MVQAHLVLWWMLPLGLFGCPVTNCGECRLWETTWSCTLTPPPPPKHGSHILVPILPNGHKTHDNLQGLGYHGLVLDPSCAILVFVYKAPTMLCVHNGQMVMCIQTLHCGACMSAHHNLLRCHHVGHFVLEPWCSLEHWLQHSQRR
jgi:hypothetical protein